MTSVGKRLQTLGSPLRPASVEDVRLRRAEHAVVRTHAVRRRNEAPPTELDRQDGHPPRDRLPVPAALLLIALMSLLLWFAFGTAAGWLLGWL